MVSFVVSASLSYVRFRRFQNPLFYYLSVLSRMPIFILRQVFYRLEWPAHLDLRCSRQQREYVCCIVSDVFWKHVGAKKVYTEATATFIE